MSKAKRNTAVAVRRVISAREPPHELTPIDLPNLGPKSAQLLARAGIDSIAKLRSLDSVAAYVAAKRAGGNVSLNLLWALEAALTGSHWREVARLHRTSLLLALEDFEKNS